MKRRSIKSVMREANETARAKGWLSKKRSFASVLCLMHSELSEALEDIRNGYGVREFYFEGKKPCGVPIELADLLIRLCEACESFEIPLEEALDLKLKYNKTRPYRHGGKKL